MTCVFCLAPATKLDGPSLPYCQYCWQSGSTCHARHFLSRWCDGRDDYVNAYHMDGARTQFLRILNHDWTKDVYLEDRF
jgi:hypothetical protein